MSKVVAKEVTINDVVNLAANIRLTDKQELEALFDLPILEQLANSVVGSDFVKSMWVNDKLICFIGVSPSTDGAGYPWMIGTTLLDKYPIEIVRQSREYIAIWLTQYKYLYNVIDARNKKTIKWLKFMGFTLHDAVPMGKYGLPFHPFTMFSKG